MSLFLPPNVRATDGNNTIISGAKWSFTLSGTTTPAPVYTTSARTTAHTNPVVANSVGRFPPIYLDPEITYRARLLDASDTLVPGYDIDPYIQAAGGSDQGYTALQDAVTAAAGGIFYLSRDWTVSAAVTVPAGTHMIGAGGSITTTGVDYNALEVAGDGITIEGVELIGPSSNSEPASEYVGLGIYAATHDNVTIKDCVIHGFSNCGILVRNCFDVKITGNRFYGNRYNSPFAYADVSDICLQSPSNAVGGRIVIAFNHCLSNNSQGIYCNSQGGDTEVAIIGNVCVTTDGTEDEIAAAALRRRHGILAGYVGVAGSGRVSIVGNIIRNTNLTGIYSSADAGNLRRAVVIANNVISKVGISDDTIQNADEALAGGIYLHGGGAATLVTGNTIYDFRGETVGDVGAITINYSLTGATASIVGNVIDTSSADGIVIKGTTPIGIRVAENYITGVARYDIYEFNTPAVTTTGGHMIENNTIIRDNTAHPSIKVEVQSSVRATYIRGNQLTGGDSTTNTDDDKNSSILINGLTKPVIVEFNLIRNYYKGVVLYGYVSTGRYTTCRFDNNHIESCNTAFVIGGSSTASCMVVENNRLATVTNTFAAGSLGGASIGYVGEHKNGRLVLLDQTAAPAVGTWLAGDEAIYPAPAAGASDGARCTTGGNPGTWKAKAALAA